ncbi:MAG: hypothetical protein AAGF86_14095 [Pseudomonadota bacterium]
MMLTELVQALIMYSEVKEFKIEMRKLRQALNQAFAPVPHPMVEQVRISGKVTPHGMNLLLSQAGQVGQYELELVPAPPDVDAADHEPEFIVKRVQGSSSDKSEWDEETLRAADFCLSAREPAQGRLTSRTRCSCQYHKSVGYDAASAPCCTRTFASARRRSSPVHLLSWLINALRLPSSLIAQGALPPHAHHPRL